MRIFLIILLNTLSCLNYWDRVNFTFPYHVPLNHWWIVILAWDMPLYSALLIILACLQVIVINELFLGSSIVSLWATSPKLGTLSPHIAFINRGRRLVILAASGHILWLLRIVCSYIVVSLGICLLVLARLGASGCSCSYFVYHLSVIGVVYCCSEVWYREEVFNYVMGVGCCGAQVSKFTLKLKVKITLIRLSCTFIDVIIAKCFFSFHPTDYRSSSSSSSIVSLLLLRRNVACL